MPNKNDGNENPQCAKVLKLGFNISVSGDSDTDFEIVLDNNDQKRFQSSLKSEEEEPQILGSSIMDAPKQELDKMHTQEVTPGQSTGDVPKNKSKSSTSLQLLKKDELQKTESLGCRDISIMNEIKSTMEHFEKFSDHIKEIPRLKNTPIATSTPFSDKCNSKSQFNLVYPEYKPRKYPHLYDHYSRKEYCKVSAKPLPPDLFLKPLPAEGYYKRGIYSRYFNWEPYRHYGSDNSLNQMTEYRSVCGKPNHDVDIPSETPSSILKKSDSESGDKQSTSSADSVKDIKIYQSGGILIMQNFKDNFDVTEKKELSEFSAKLIENCNKLRMEANSYSEDKPVIGNSSDENKSSGKMVQFDLSSFESQKSKSGDSSSNIIKDESSSRMESSESTSDCLKIKDSSPQCTSQGQDFPSISTQENDSIISNQPGLSPTYASSKKLEWDSGADIGYLNLDLTKENLSTIEKIVLKGLSSDGTSEKNVVYEKTSELSQTNPSKFILERKPSEDMDGIIKINERDLAVTTDGKKKESNRSSLRESERKSRRFLEEVENKKSFGEISSEVIKGEAPYSCKEIEFLKKVSTKSRSASPTNEIRPKESTDKSVNVNTLFESVGLESPINRNVSKSFCKSSESATKLRHKKSPKLSLIKSKRASPQRLLKAPKKNSVNAKVSSSNSVLGMGIPKNVYKKVEAIPLINDVELSREVEEIIIDQRFKIKQNLAATKEPNIPGKDDSKEVKSKNKPNSVSPSSNNTALPTSEAKENVEEKIEDSEQNKFIDQDIQTSEYDCESVGIQAFASQVSSSCEFMSFRKSKTSKEMTKGERENVNISSKNIQAFGLNASLPKQLEHPRERELIDNQHTKSTQFFGGPLNSLPNYHSNVISISGESGVRGPNILKPKKNSETEIIRVKEENEKNILANDTPKLSEHKNDSRKHSGNENKENLIGQKSVNSKRSHNTSHKNSKKDSGDSDKKEREVSHTKGKKKSPLVVGSDGPHTSDEVSSMILTSEVLKVHGDCVDRNIIQEKYFQSQLVELEKRKMVSRSTSMEFQLQFDDDEAPKEYMTIACQYSPPSRGGTSKKRENNSVKKIPGKKIREKASLEQCASSKNLIKENSETSKSTNPEQNSGAGDSLPSSTQTARSWILGMQNSREETSGIGRARSFEYLPGHIYESSGNLREKLPSDTEQNLITSSSDSTTAKISVSDGGARDSEGRDTLVLENSTDASHDSDQLKILDETLAQLDLVVLKLQEKDSQVQDVTQSLLANLWKRNGSGDSTRLGRGDSSETEVGNKSITDGGKERGNTITKKPKRESTFGKEFSIACQTEEKSTCSDPGKLYEDRKALEKRISEEKKCQIKWIENEIHHLNILKELLEKQNGPNHKKKSPVTLVSSDASKSEENYSKTISQEICPRIITPVYGCTISVTENASPERNKSEENDCQPRVKEPCSPQYGMAVSLSGCSKNWRRVVMLPVGLQVSLNDNNLFKECLNEEPKSPPPTRHRHPSSVESNNYKPAQSDIFTQYPSTRGVSENIHSGPVQTGLSSYKKSTSCTQENCFCINLSDCSSSSVTHSSRSKGSDKKESSKLHLLNEEFYSENKTSNTTEPELGEAENYSVSQLEKKIARKSADEKSDLSGCKCAQSTNCKCQKINGKSECSGCNSKHISIQTTSCKCRTSPKRMSCACSKQAINCRGTCQSNIYINHEKPTKEFGACHCSKIQVQKSSNCACHIIKIHGSKCCSTESSPCSCKRRNLSKKTENQSCQTDVKSVQEIKILSEAEAVVEKKSSIVEKFPVDPKVAYEKIQPGSDIVMFEEKESWTRRIPQENVPVKVNCGCRKTIESEKVKADDHPRHYFLKIQEEEVDEIEPTRQKKSLEVVTVTVPVKKAGKSKIYAPSIPQTRDSYKKSYADAPSASCNCSECVENCCVPPQGYSYRRSTAEKPESPTRNPGLLKAPQNSCEDLSFYDNDYPSRQRRTPQDYYESRNSVEFEPRPKSSYSKRPLKDNFESRCCKGCNCLNENAVVTKNLTEYDSHKKCRSIGIKDYREDENERVCKSKKKNELQQSNPKLRYDTERLMDDDWDSESRRSRSRRFNNETDRSNPDYYDYKKREFMTKSEILKEEEQKRKVVQPSLQECLSSNRPDFYSSAERRRQIISERSKARLKGQNNRMECLIKMMQQCNERDQPFNAGPRRIFTTVQMREQTMKRYKKLPEVTGKISDQKKKEEYRTNRLMADVFAKKLQIEALKGHINLSNSVSVLYTL